MSAKQIRAIAAQIADQLFVNGFGEEADQLKLIRVSDRSRDLGGWGKLAVENLIVAILARQQASRRSPGNKRGKKQTGKPVVSSRVKSSLS